MIDYENLAKSNALFEREFEARASEVIRRGHFILGSQVSAFEQEFGQWHQSEHPAFCIGVASGLDALTLSLAALELPPGSEVIVPSNTYIATVLSILQAGHKPVLVEPDITTYNIDPRLIEKSITAKTKALMIVHLYGRACEMSPIMEICRKHGLQLIEDCAQSHGAWATTPNETLANRKKTGTFGIGAFSFYPTKNLGALGDAGAILCHDEALANKLRALRNYGSHQKYHNQYVGWNSRLDELQAGFLRVKLKHLDKINEHKRELARIYDNELESRFIKPKSDQGHVYHIYNIRVEARDRLREFLLERGVRTEVHYPIPPHEQVAYKHLFAGQKFPISEEIHRTTLSLPISFCHTEADVREVCRVLNSF